MIKGSSCLICLSFGDRDRGRLPYYCVKNIPGRLPGSGRFPFIWPKWVPGRLPGSGRLPGRLYKSMAVLCTLQCMQRVECALHVSG